MTKASAICHMEIPTTDLARSKTFYEDVFGWSGQHHEGKLYHVSAVPGDDGEGYSASGGFEPDHEPVRDARGVILYLECADVTAHLAQIEAAGGEAVKAKTKIGDDYGYIGLFRDPSGNLLGVWSRV